mmetsp:Transcript_79996/g.222517  ORF Transcript_79996/g.222517 Transcript_79996/m.222517 type:complete len:381 (+) Transcript_79996:24-1166(+)
MCYMLLLGKPPFRGSNNIKIVKAILDGEFARDGRWDTLSRGAQDFLEGLLRKDPAERFDAQRALAHSWLCDLALGGNGATSSSSPPRACASPGAAAQGELGPEVLKSLRKFAQGSHLQRAALTVMAYGLTSREIQDFEQAFLAMDTTGRGTITLEQLAQVMARYPEVSSQEVQRIFKSMESSKEEEIHYTPFIAAMLATRVRFHEDKVRSAFEAFDFDGTGYITAETLTRIFERIPDAGDLAMEEAEEWIREVDYKGNGTIDYEEFMAALTGKHVWAVMPLEDECPVVRVFSEQPDGERPLVRSSSFDGGTASSRGRALLGKTPALRMRHRVAAILDGDDSEEEVVDKRRPQSFHPGAASAAVRVQVRNVACDIDENYFK